MWTVLNVGDVPRNLVSILPHLCPPNEAIGSKFLQSPTFEDIWIPMVLLDPPGPEPKLSSSLPCKHRVNRYTAASSPEAANGSQVLEPAHGFLLVCVVF